VRKKLTILAGAAFLGVLIFAGVVLRDEITIQYHSFRLRREPQHLHQILSNPEGTNERAAVRRYLATEEGKVALLRECVPQKYDRMLLKLGVAGDINVSIKVNASKDTITFVHNPIGLELYHNVTPEWSDMAEEYLGHDTFDLPEYPDVTFEYVKLPHMTPTNNEDSSMAR